MNATTLAFPVQIYHAVDEFDDKIHAHEGLLKVSYDLETPFNDTGNFTLDAIERSGPWGDETPVELYQTHHLVNTEEILFSIREKVLSKPRDTYEPPALLFYKNDEYIKTSPWRDHIKHIEMDTPVFENIVRYFAVEVRTTLEALSPALVLSGIQLEMNYPRSTTVTYTIESFF